MSVLFYKSITGGIMGILTYLFGGYDALMMAIIAVMCIETIASVIKNINLKEVSSEFLFSLAYRKIGILSLIALANVIDNILELSGVLRKITISYFIASEGLSLVESWGEMGLPVPDKLRMVLDRLKKGDGDG